MYRFLLLSTILLFHSMSALAADDEIEGRAEINWRIGQERSIMMSEFWLPILQDEKSVFYANLRMMGDDQNNREGNLGVG